MCGIGKMRTRRSSRSVRAGSGRRQNRIESRFNPIQLAALVERSLIRRRNPGLPISRGVLCRFTTPGGRSNHRLSGGNS
jgi:hypothetical protein